MAGRYLLIEFDDEASATHLREQIDAATRRGKRFRVIGLFAKPGPHFCGCGTWISTRGQAATIHMGRKFGWMVCSTCGKPAPIISAIRNLIKPEEIINPPKVDILDTKGLVFYPYSLSMPTKRV